MLRAAATGVLAIFAASLAQAECPSAGFANKIKLPFVRAQSPCGYHGREADASTAWGPTCSTAATGLKDCFESNDLCSTDAQCSLHGCTFAPIAVNPKESCDSIADCLPSYGVPSQGCANRFGTTCSNHDALYQSAYKFDSTGRCSMSATTKVIKDCSTATNSAGIPLGLPAGPCQLTYLKAACKGVLRNDGTPVLGVNDQFELELTVRIVLDDGSTTLDVPLHLPFDRPEDGKMSLATTSAEALMQYFAAAPVPLPACTAIEIVRAQINDSYPKPFATVGLATR